MKDIYSNLLIKRAISPLTQTNADTAFVSQIIDRQGFESVLFAIATGGLTDADATFTVLVEDGDDAALSDYSAVADQYLNGTEAGASFTFTNDNEVRKIGYIGNKRYVRLTITPSGNNSGAAPLAAIAILGNSAARPVTQASA